MKDYSNKIVHFTKYDATGKWKGNGIGKVVAVDHGTRVIVSIHSHPFFKEQDLVSLYLWTNENRYRADVIIKEVKDK